MLGNFFIIYVDHYALKYLLNKAELAGRVIRWMLLLQDFDFEMVTKPGKSHVLADHLSRLLTEDMEEGVYDELQDATLFFIDVSLPWYADIANFLSTAAYPVGANK